MNAELARRTPMVDDNKAEWNQLVTTHGRAVLLSLLSWGVRLDRAHDMAQETWTRLYVKWEKGEIAHLQLPGLAITQARFFAMNDHARTRATEAIENVVLEHDAPTPEERLISAEQLTRALTAIHGLTPAARRVFDSVYDDPSRAHAVVAAELGMSVQRLRQTLCEVRAQLRATIHGGDA